MSFFVHHNYILNTRTIYVYGFDYKNTSMDQILCGWAQFVLLQIKIIAADHNAIIMAWRTDMSSVQHDYIGIPRHPKGRLKGLIRSLIRVLRAL